MLYGGEIMLGLPKKTEINKILPKESFYRNLDISNELKAKFISDIKKITITNILSEKTINVKPGKEVTEIIVLNVELKEKSYDKRILELIAKQNEHHLIFNIQYGKMCQQVVWSKKLYENDWSESDGFELRIEGLELEDIWKSMVLDIVGINTNKTNSIESLLENQEEIDKMKKQILILQKKVVNEKQANKQFEMNTRLKEYRKKLKQLEEKI